MIENVMQWLLDDSGEYCDGVVIIMCVGGHRPRCTHIYPVDRFLTKLVTGPPAQFFLKHPAVFHPRGGRHKRFPREFPQDGFLLDSGRNSFKWRL